MTNEERNNLCIANDKLIHLAAKKYRSLSIPYDDLYQEGFIALMNAAEKFDESKGTNFSTYAVNAINNALKRYVIGDRAIPVPEYRNTQMLAVAEAVKSIEDSGGIVDKASLAKHLDINENEAMELLRIYNSGCINSIDAVNAETGDPLSDMLSDSNDITLDVEREIMKDDIHTAISEVYGERTADVVCFYYGIGVDRNHTLGETGEKYGITKERVRQIVSDVDGSGSKKGKAVAGVPNTSNAKRSLLRKKLSGYEGC